MKIDIYTDGSCLGNPGPGGWAFLIMFDGKEHEHSGGATDTTNNRMELAAVIVALEALKKPCTVDLYSDSRYVINGITKWIKAWKQNGWKTSGKKAVENKDLWERLDRATQGHAISWTWVKGHSTQDTEHAFWNNLVDMVAVREKEQAHAELAD